METLAEMIRNAFKTTKNILLVIIFFSSLAFNVAAMVVGAAWTVVSSVIEDVGGVPQKGSIASKEKEAAKLEASALTSESKAAKLSDDLAISETKVASLKGELQASREVETLAGRSAKKVAIEGEEMAVSDAVKLVTNRVKTRTAKLATTDLAATVGQSLPWIGIAAVIAATGYDLKSSCDTMRDMQALDVAFNPDTAHDPSVAEVCGLQVPTQEEVWTAIKSSPAKAWDETRAVFSGLPDMTNFGWGSLPDMPSLPDFSSMSLPTFPEINWTPWN